MALALNIQQTIDILAAKYGFSAEEGRRLVEQTITAIPVAAADAATPAAPVAAAAAAVAAAAAPPAAPTKSIVDILPELAARLEKNIKTYHQMFALPLADVYWENVLHNTLAELGHPTDWVPDRSHQIGKDLSVPSLVASRISCKAGTIAKNREYNELCVTFSGSRTTKHEAIADKVAHLSGDHQDYYFLLSKRSTVKGKAFDMQYTLLVFHASLVSPDKLVWSAEPEKGKWFGRSACPDQPFHASITKKMSDQLWTCLPVRHIPYHYVINGVPDSA